MNRKILGGIVFGAAAGLAGLLAGCNARPHNYANVDTSDLPAENQTLGRRMTICEGDVQDTPNNELSISVSTPHDEILPTGAIAFVERGANGEIAPYDVSLHSDTYADGSSDHEIRLRDNNYDFVNGEVWTVEVRGTSIAGVNKVYDRVHVTYFEGNCGLERGDVDSNGVHGNDNTDDGNHDNDNHGGMDNDNTDDGNHDNDNNGGNVNQNVNVNVNVNVNNNTSNPDPCMYVTCPADTVSGPRCGPSGNDSFGNIVSVETRYDCNNGHCDSSTLVHTLDTRQGDTLGDLVCSEDGMKVGRVRTRETCSNGQFTLDDDFVQEGQDCDLGCNPETASCNSLSDLQSLIRIYFTDLAGNPMETPQHISDLDVLNFELRVNVPELYSGQSPAVTLNEINYPGSDSLDNCFRILQFDSVGTSDLSNGMVTYRHRGAIGVNEPYDPINDTRIECDPDQNAERLQGHYSFPNGHHDYSAPLDVNRFE